MIYWKKKKSPNEGFLAGEMSIDGVSIERSVWRFTTCVSFTLISQEHDKAVSVPALHQHADIRGHLLSRVHAVFHQSFPSAAVYYCELKFF